MDRPVIVFDVNETLLDLSALRPPFEEVLDPSLMSLWFARMLFNSTVATLTGVYQPFDRQGVDALVATAFGAGVTITEKDAERVVAGMTELPPHGDVVPALTMLRDAGFRLATLTNSSEVVVNDQIRNAGIDSFFERLLSVDGVGSFKPDPRVYHYAAQELGVGIDRLRLVAAHPWDVTGAIRAGALAAFVQRGSSRLGALSETPDVVGPDLEAVAARIIET